ncbi:2189_t:CDS:2 [Funneliformis mosseae]|uniref:2189_t:CDS:1 n=1 Tax=Funneliformis mosseae TaxID=27381 RepID=A0A9N9BMR8_FUNMO|nr:2189_t:CDS:2 [Funneliformis mosseae]
MKVSEICSDDLDLYVCILRSDYGSSLKIDHGRTIIIKQHSKDDDDIRLISSEGSTVLKADDQNVQESPKQEITMAAVPITKFHLLISEIETAFNEMLTLK